MQRRSAKGAFQPHELQFLKRSFDEITSQNWFPQSDEEKERFARFLLETCPEDAFDRQKHRSVIEASARMFYAVDDDS